MKFPFWLKAFLFVLFSSFLGLFTLPTKVENSRWLKIEGDVDLIWKNVSTEEGWSHWMAKEQGQEMDFWLSGRASIKKSDSDPSTKWTVQYVIDESMDEGLLQLQLLPEDKGAWIKWNHTANTGYSPLERLRQLSNKRERALAMDRGLERLAELCQSSINGQSQK